LGKRKKKKHSGGNESEKREKTKHIRPQVTAISPPMKAKPTEFLIPASLLDVTKSEIFEPRGNPPHKFDGFGTKKCILTQSKKKLAPVLETC